ncbi:hypothetical protein [Bosea sp. BIWAKO-01]|uniref:hypothetical protein n=1 Tax=Bosea sp. BIWAKO-01 TaxID=506668 RepID=UPI00114CF472|nr:hypothetical protein [Bosea sp. BIWAKO-01]
MRTWRTFNAEIIATIIITTFCLWLFVLFVDPYDTGRFALLPKRSLSAISNRMAVASLGRNPQFNGVIIGNSHVAPLSPQRLSEYTGLEFVALTLPGASVAPELSVLKWFLTHRETPPRAIIIGIDDVWCRTTPRYMEEPPQPTWLIDESPIAYAASAFRYDGLEQAFQRFWAPSKTVARPPNPRGFWDLELDFIWDKEKVLAELSKPWISSINLSGEYPSLKMLGETLKSASNHTAVALVLLPVWADTLPKGGQELISEESCKRAMRDFIKSRKGGILIDGRSTNVMTTDPRNFFDRTHYREPIAREIEAELALQLKRGL